MLKKLSQYFFNGLLLVAPVAITCYIVILVFTTIDKTLSFPIPGVGYKIPGLGILITILLITLLGFFATNYLTKRIVRSVDNLFARLPFTKLIYTSIRDLIGAFVGDKKSFDVPVMIQLFDNSPALVLGFITQKDTDFLGLPGHVAVYLPQSYNFAGQLVIIPSDRVKKVDINSSEVMALVVSGGTKRMTNPEEGKTE